MSYQQTVPPMISVPIFGALLGLSPATAYRAAKSLPRAPIPGRWRICTSDFEKLFGRSLTADEYQRAVAKARGEELHETDGSDIGQASKIEGTSDGKLVA